MATFMHTSKVGFGFEKVDKRYRNPHTPLPPNWRLSDNGKWFIRENVPITYYSADEIVAAAKAGDMKVINRVAKEHFEQAKIKQRDKCTSEIYAEVSAKALEAMRNECILYASKNDAENLAEVLTLDKDAIRAYYEEFVSSE